MKKRLSCIHCGSKYETFTRFIPFSGWGDSEERNESPSESLNMVRTPLLDSPLLDSPLLDSF